MKIKKNSLAVIINLLFFTFCATLPFSAYGTDAFSHLEMRTEDDSVFLMDSYNRLRNDKKMCSPMVQDNKKEVQDIVNSFIKAKKDTTEIDNLIKFVFPDLKEIISSRQEEIPQEGQVKRDKRQEDGLYEENTLEEKKYKYFITYITEKGKTVEKEIGEHIKFAFKMAESIERTNDKYSSRHGDILLTAFNMALQDDTREMDRFVKETKQNYIDKELAKHTLATKDDSISFAKGYFTGKSTADTLTIKDNYDFLEGLAIGYKSNNLGKIGWLQIINIMESRPLATQEIFMLGISVGRESEKDGYEPSFIPGAYYGFAGEQTQWTEKAMEAYLKKNIIDPSSLFGTWKAHSVVINEKGTKKDSKKIKKQASKDLLSYKIIFVDDNRFVFQKNGETKKGDYRIKKNELIFHPDSYSISFFNEGKTLSESMKENNDYTIKSITEEMLELTADIRNSEYDYSVTICFRKQK